MSAPNQKRIPPLPSTSELLPSLISSAQAQQILRRQGDAREIFAQVASLRGQSETELMAELGSILGLPCADEISRTTRETPWDAEFLRYGALPVVIGERVVGAYCIDPYRIRHLVSAEVYRSIVLVPWGLLSSFVTQEPSANLELRNRPDPEPSTGLIALLELILDEARSLGRHTVALSMTTRGISYEFLMEDGESLTGLLEGSSELHGEGIAALVEQADPITLRDGGQIRLTKDMLGRIILTEVIPAAPPGSSEHAEGPQRRKEVLLIEDDPTFSLIVSDVLGASGYHVTSVCSLSEALDLLKKGPIRHAIISDLNIADSSGLATIAQLLSQNIIAPCQVVVLSNEDDGQLEASLLRLGIRGVIPKNRDPEVLLAYLEQMLGIIGTV